MFPASSLLPIAVSAATSVAGQLADSAARGLSFARMLAQKPDGDASRAAGTPANRPVESTLTAAGRRTQHDALVRAVESSRAQLEAVLSRKLRQHGIDASQPIELEVDASGHVLEASGHLDRDKIERLFETDPELAASVRRLVRQADLAYADGNTNQTRDIAPRTRLMVADGQLQLKTG